MIFNFEQKTIQISNLRTLKLDNVKITSYVTIQMQEFVC
jgi:hypothetical protein